MAEQTIGEVALGGTTKLIFSVSEWRGRQFAGVRKFVATQKYEGWTKAGLSMPRNLLRAVLDTLAALEHSLPPNGEHEFKRIPKGDTEYIKVTTLPPDDDSLPLVDVREFVDKPTYQGPTKSGIRFRWNLLPEVLACLREQAKVIGEAERNEPTLFGPGAFAEPEDPKPAPHVGAHENGIAALLGEDIKAFPAHFLDGDPVKGKAIRLPESPLRLEQDNSGDYYLKTDEGPFCPVRNPAEANFIIYAQMCGQTEVAPPIAMIHIFKAVKAYENYVRTVQARLVAKVMKKVGQQSVAEYEARKKMSAAGLPWLSDD
jgi:hypothetical protein